jgi:uroporphyrinogen-III synthase
VKALGASPILIPTIEIGPPTSFAALDAALERLTEFDLVAFTSANAVEAFRERAAGLGIVPAPRSIAVVGPATARALERMGLRAEVTPAVYTAEALLETLLPEAEGRSMLLVLAEQAPATLEVGLKDAGATVTVAPAYGNHIPAGSREAITELFAELTGRPDAVTFTSASTAVNLVALLEAAGQTLPESVMRASIGPVTSRALRDLGLPPHIEAIESTIPGLVDALAESL